MLLLCQLFKRVPALRTTFGISGVPLGIICLFVIAYAMSGLMNSNPTCILQTYKSRVQLHCAYVQSKYFTIFLIVEPAVVHAWFTDVAERGDDTVNS